MTLILKKNVNTCEVFFVTSLKRLAKNNHVISTNHLAFEFVLNPNDGRVALSSNKRQWFLVEQQMFQKLHLDFLETSVTKHKCEIKMTYISFLDIYIGFE